MGMKTQRSEERRRKEEKGIGMKTQRSEERRRKEEKGIGRSGSQAVFLTVLYCHFIM